MSQSHIRIPSSTALRDDIVHCTHDEIHVIRGWPKYILIIWRAYACGHRDHRRYSINAYGEILRYEDSFFTEALRCGRCQVRWLKENSIRCFRCGHIIQDGEAVARYTYMPQTIPRYAVAIMEKEGQGYLGCCRAEGCLFFDTTANGKWTKKEGYTPFAPGSASIPVVLMHDYLRQHSSYPPKSV